MLIINDLFNEKINSELCDSVFCKYADINNVIDIKKMSQYEIVITLIWQSFGLIGNSGFRHLFSGDFNGDPGFIITLDCYKVIGAKTAYKSFSDAVAVFPKGKMPNNTKKRLVIYDTIDKNGQSTIDRAFYKCEKEIINCLAKYIRKHKKIIIHDISSRLTSR